MSISTEPTFTSDSPSPRGSFVAKIILSLFFSIFLICGLFLSYKIGGDFLQAIRTRRWQPTACTVVRSRITEKGSYRCDLLFRYESGGREFTSTVLKDHYNGSDDYYDAQKLLDQYPAGKQTVCLMNPADPTQAVLQAPSLWTGLGLLFPLPFIFIGGGAIYLFWRPARPVQARVKVRHPKVAMGLFFSLFFIAGLAIMAFLVPMILRGRAAKSWPVVPCSVVRSGVESHTSNSRHGSSTTYSVTVLFRYTYAGKNHSSSRYALVHSSTSNYDAQKQIADSLIRPRKRTCYVNPTDPADAVLDRSITGVTIVLGILSAVFLLAGSSGLRWVLHAAALEHQRILEEHLSPGARGTAELKPAISSGVRYAKTLLGPLVWNALTGPIVYLAFTDWQSSHTGIQWVILAGVLELFGVLMVFQALLKVRMLLQPDMRMLLSQRPVTAGKEAEIRWQFPDPGQVSHLKIQIAAYKQTESQVGLPALREIHPYWTVNLIDTTAPVDIASGRQKFTIPPEQIAGDDQRVIWAFLVDADLRKPPALQQEFPFTVVRD